MRQPDRISWSQAAVSGLLFALISCTWRYLSDGADFDELAIRFAAYFLAFTVGFYFLYNLVVKRQR